MNGSKLKACVLPQTSTAAWLRSLADQVRHRLMPRRFPLRWLSRGPYWYLLKQESLLDQVIPEDGWISWEAARDALTVEQLAEMALTGGLYADALSCQPRQSRLWAEDTLHISIAHGVLTLVDRRRVKQPQARAAQQWLPFRTEPAAAVWDMDGRT